MGISFGTEDPMDKGYTAACIAVGSELLGDDRVDTNSLTVARALAGHGVPVVEKRVIGDSVERLAEAIRELLDRVDVLVVTGGLGPTRDDITREAAAAALGRELEYNPEVEDWVRSRYDDLGRPMPELCRKMAYVVRGAAVLPNPRGAAPGQLISIRNRLLVLFPGVPWEMEAMLNNELLPEVAARSPGIRVHERIVLLGGVFESAVEERLEAFYERFGREDLTVLASCGVVRLALRVAGADTAAQKRLSDMESELRKALGAEVAGVDVCGLEEVVLTRLRASCQTLAAAESCTGGMLAARITDVPGASDAFLGGVVTYSNEAKENFVDVPHRLLVERGAVSEPVARAMAEGVRARFQSDWGVAITGIAGPSGGTEGKPVGLVHWAVAGSAGTVTEHRIFPGDRGAVRSWSVNSVLDLLRRQMDVVNPT